MDAMLVNVALFVAFCVFIYLLDYPEGDNFKIARAPRSRRSQRRVEGQSPLRARLRSACPPRLEGAAAPSPKRVAVTVPGCAKSRKSPAGKVTDKFVLGNALPSAGEPTQLRSSKLVTRAPPALTLASLPPQGLVRAVGKTPLSSVVASKPSSSPAASSSESTMTSGQPASSAAREATSSGGKAVAAAAAAAATAATLVSAVRCLKETRDMTLLRGQGFSCDETSA